jgi:hypothetical protein
MKNHGKNLTNKFYKIFKLYNKIAVILFTIWSGFAILLIPLDWEFYYKGRFCISGTPDDYDYLSGDTYCRFDWAWFFNDWMLAIALNFTILVAPGLLIQYALGKWLSTKESVKF